MDPLNSLIDWLENVQGVDLSHKSTVEIVDALVDAGVVYREGPDLHDSFSVALTQKGVEIFESYNQPMEES